MDEFWMEWEENMAVSDEEQAETEKAMAEALQSMPEDEDYYEDED